MEIEKNHYKNISTDAKAIKPINVDTVHKICSGQVVLSLSVAVKELVENSLDAGATNIDVRLKNYGMDFIEVSDNGSGVTEDNFAALTLKYHTSKLSEYSDLLGVASYGFRGEALSSLCELASMTIITRHQSSEYATKLEYDHKGNIAKKIPCSRQIGTTVCLSNLFSSLPVRQKEFHKNAKREFNKMTQILYAYCLISLGVKITCTNQTATNPKSIVVATEGANAYKDNIASIFGIKQLQNILEITPVYEPSIKENIFKGLSGEIEQSQETLSVDDTEMDLSEDSNDADNTDGTTNSQKSQGYKNIANPIDLTGFISSCAHGYGRSTTDRQFFFVNGRPCEPTKIIKLINEIYRQYNSSQYPFVFLNINIDRVSVDINLTPDKRKVFLTKEKMLLDVLKSSLVNIFESIPRTLKIDSNNMLVKNHSDDVKPSVDQPRVFNAFIQRFASKNSKFDENKTTKEVTNGDLKRKSTTMLDFISSKKSHKLNDLHLQQSTELPKTELESSEIQDNQSIKKRENENVENKDSSSSEEFDIVSRQQESEEVMYLNFTDNLPNTQIRNIDDVVIIKSHTTICKNKLSIKENICKESPEIERPAKKQKILTDKEDLGKYNRRVVNMKTSIEYVTALTDIYNKQKTKVIPDRIKFRSKINPVYNKKCEEELSKEISNDTFKQMATIGQFNLGFIITRLGDDLFIIDQHATDEIYNFETLQKTTELTSQKLVIPQQMELTGVNEQILMDNLDIFKKNGFTFDIDEQAPPTKRVKLLTLPMSKNWIFGKDDIEELLFMLRESPTEHCRPSRVRAMFASRACRKSVMIGTALSKADMKKLVDHMSEIEQPWNCPHGRPTIRHLVNLAIVNVKNS